MVTYEFIFTVIYVMETGKKRSKPTLIAEDQLIKLGERIKSLRLEAGYASYETFAYEHNLPRAQYGRYEQGKDLRFSSLVKVIAAFGMTLDEFFNDGFTP